MKKFVADRPFADADPAARKIVEIANGIENGRIYIECVKNVREPHHKNLRKK